MALPEQLTRRLRTMQLREALCCECEEKEAGNGCAENETRQHDSEFRVIDRFANLICPLKHDILAQVELQPP